MSADSILKTIAAQVPAEMSVLPTGEVFFCQLRTGLATLFAELSWSSCGTVRADRFNIWRGAVPEALVAS